MVCANQVTHYQLLVDPVYTSREAWMTALKCTNGDSGPAVEAVNEEDIIDRTELLGSHPNPFNPVTKVSYTLKSPGVVELVVYDLRGRRVRVLDDGFKEAGRYEIPWTGIDHTDHRVASGVYLARFRADGVTSTERLLLIK